MKPIPSSTVPPDVGGCGMVAVGFFMGVAADVILAALLSAVTSAMNSNQCAGGISAFCLAVAITIAIPLFALWRVRYARPHEGPLWAGFLIATFLPFLPCTLFFAHGAIRC